MLTKEELIKLSDPDESKLSIAEYGAKRSVLSRGLPYYGELRKKFPVHWISFQNMQKRSRREFICEISDRYSFDVSGFINFIIDIGNVPEGMCKPSVGRKDHLSGYIEGNFAWQSASDNSRESAIRNCIIDFELLKSIIIDYLYTNISLSLLSSKYSITTRHLYDIFKANYREDLLLYTLKDIGISFEDFRKFVEEKNNYKLKSGI